MATSKTNDTHSGHLELDNAFRYAVTLAWGDLMKPIEPRSIRVEYLSEPGTALAGRHGLILIHPPDADDRWEAITWMKEVQAPQGEPRAGEVPVLPEDHRQDEEASSRMDDEGHSIERAENGLTRQDTRATSGSILLSQ